MATITETKTTTRQKQPNLTLKLTTPGAATGEIERVKLTTPVPAIEKKKLNCYVCTALMRDAVTTKCGHSMCGTCFERRRLSGSCMCGNPIKNYWDCVADQSIRAQVDELQPAVCPDCQRTVPSGEWLSHCLACTGRVVKCANQYKGCAVSGPFTEIFKDHMPVCPYNETVCRYCGMKLLVKDITEHEEQYKCEAMKRPCTYRCGVVDQTKSEMASHEAVCPYRPDECTHPGCDFKGFNSEVKCHVTECADQHIRLLSKRIEQLEGDKQTAAGKLESFRRDLDAVLLMVKGITEGMIPKPVLLLNANDTSVTKVSSLVMEWHIPRFFEKVMNSKPGDSIKSADFMYLATGSKYPYLLGMRIFPQGTLKDPSNNVYVLVKNQGTPKDDCLKWPVPDEFWVEIVGAKDGRCLHINSITERRDKGCGGVLGSKDEVIWNVDDRGYLKINLRVKRSDETGLPQCCL